MLVFHDYQIYEKYEKFIVCQTELRLIFIDLGFKLILKTGKQIIWNVCYSSSLILCRLY